MLHTHARLRETRVWGAWSQHGLRRKRKSGFLKTTLRRATPRWRRLWNACLPHGQWWPGACTCALNVRNAKGNKGACLCVVCAPGILLPGGATFLGTGDLTKTKRNRLSLGEKTWRSSLFRHPASKLTDASLARAQFLAQDQVQMLILHCRCCISQNAMGIAEQKVHLSLVRTTPVDAQIRCSSEQEAHLALWC